MKKTFYITTPIYYPNARPHVGSAYTTIVCDVLARYKRMCGYDVAFLTGTDEHGEKLARAAAAAGKTPEEFVAEKRELFVDLWKKLGMEVVKYPESPAPGRLSLRFINTHHPDHIKSVQRLLIRAREKGFIYSKRYEGRYCIYDERYVSDNTDTVNCDICGRPAELISEDNYFFRLSAFEKPLLELYKNRPDFVQPDYRMNEVQSFVKSGLRDISVSRSRLKWGIPWPDDPRQVFYVWYDALTSYMTGIGYAQDENGSPEFRKYWRNVPGEGEIVHMIGKDILRFHAVYWPAFIMAAYPGQPEMLPSTIFAHGWIYYEQDKMSKSKGNVVYPEPIVDALDSFGAPGNDALRYYLLREAPFGQDTSFSYDGLIQRFNSDLANDLGNLANRTITMLHKLFGGKVPAPVTGSGIYSHLAEPLGLPTEEQEIGGMATEIGRRYCKYFDSYKFSQALDCAWQIVARFNKYLVDNHPWTWLKEFDPMQGKYVVTDEHLKTVLYTAAEALRFNAVILYPILPSASEQLWKQLRCEEYLGRIADQRIDQLKWGELKHGTEVGKPEPIFPRLDKEKTLAKLDEFSERDRERDKPAVRALRETPLQADPAEADRHRDKPKEAFKSVETDKSQESGVRSQESGVSKQEPDQATAPESPSGTGFQPVKEDTAKMAVPQVPSPQQLAPSPAPSREPRVPNSEAPTPAAEPPKISIEDFAKVEMRTGEIKTAEAIPGAKKLLKLTVDIGTEVRQVCAGIAEYYAPEKLVGMKVVIVTNLLPRKMRGVESNGMIVAASIGDQGRPVLVTFAEDVPNGARLK